MINKSKLLVKVAREYLKNQKSKVKIKVKKKIPWPLAFVQNCIKEVDKRADQEEFRGNVADDEGFAGTFTPSYGHSSIFEFNECLEIWKKIEKKFKLKMPVPGSLVIWKKTDNTGHISIVLKAIDANRIEVIEATKEEIIKKTRFLKKEKDLSLVGIITPWH